MGNFVKDQIQLRRGGTMFQDDEHERANDGVC